MLSNGFHKISLQSENPSTFQKEHGSAVQKPGKKSRKKKISIILLATLVILILLGGWFFIRINSLVIRLKESEQSARKLSASLKNQNLDESKQFALETKEKLKKTQTEYQALAFTGFIPFLGSYYKDGEHGFAAAQAGLESLIITVDSLIPYADLLGLKGKGTFTGGSADQRIQTAVATFEKVIPNLSAVGEKVEVVKREVDAINPNRYPEKIGATVVRSKIVAVRDLTHSLTTLFLSARPLLEELPTILGTEKPKRYLVVFLNDKELRPTGGFITAYAIFRVDKGKPTVEKADDIYKLDDSRKKKVAAPPEILKYHKGVYYFNLRDSNISPDFVTSINEFESLYKDVSDPVAYDGILTVDTHVLVKAIEILGPFVVYGRTFSADNDPRCNCPRAVYELEDYSSRPVAYVREERKDIIGVLLLQIMQKALGVSPSQYWGRLFQMILTQLDEKHILVYFKNERAQTGVEALNWGGRIKAYNGDYLQITDTNYAGAKSDLFVKRSVKQDISIGNDGSVVKTVTIDYKNPAPASDCNLESGGLCLNGLLRNWVRIYVPEGSTLLSTTGGESPKDDGSQLEMVSKKDLGKTVFEGYIRVRPQSSSRLEVKYSLPFKVTKGKVYDLLIQKQPGSDENEYSIFINGREKDKFPLQTDKDFHLKY